MENLGAVSNQKLLETRNLLESLKATISGDYIYSADMVGEIWDKIISQLAEVEEEITRRDESGEL